MALPKSSLVSKIGTLGVEWLQWFTRADQTVMANRRLGPTSSRPLPRDAYLGMRYIDTDLGPAGVDEPDPEDVLGRPIYAVKITPSAVTWIDANGVEV
ncbi:MAG: hypothetical protein KF822_09495 [Steroidobacteraceae bacterium]|nr:hypothetical protein [Steroidobacteraceae bacterium]